MSGPICTHGGGDLCAECFTPERATEAMRVKRDETYAWLARHEHVATLTCQRCGWGTHVKWLDGQPDDMRQAVEWLRIHYETRHA